MFCFKTSRNITILLKSRLPLHYLLPRAYEQEMTFKVQVIERELAEEKKRGRIDISSIDTKLKGEYEAR